MSRLDVAAATEALAPVRQAMLDRARADADALLEAATAETAQTLQRATSDAASEVSAATETGATEAAAALAGDRARLRRQAREVILRAQRAAYDDLRTEAGAAVRALRDDPDYPAMRARLVSLGRDLLGPSAQVDDAPDGGVLVRVGTRTAVLSLESVLDDVLTEMGPAVQRLWVP